MTSGPPSLPPSEKGALLVLSGDPGEFVGPSAAPAHSSQSPPPHPRRERKLPLSGAACDQLLDLGGATVANCTALWPA